MTEKPTSDSLPLESFDTLKAEFLNTLQREPRKRKGEKNVKALQYWQNEILERIEAFLKCDDFNVNFCDGEISQSPLWQATMRPETIDKFLKRKTTDLNLSDPKGRTAIFLAVESRQPQTIKLLKKAGALVEWRDSEGRTPLSRAVELGHLETVRFLVEQENAMINPDDGLDPTPLQRAVSIGSTKIVQYLLANAAKVNHRDAYGRTPFSMAVSLGPSEAKKDIIGLLIERDADLDLADCEGNTPLINAVVQSDVESVRQLLESKNSIVNVDQYARGRTPFSLAAGKSRVVIMQLLLDYRADPHKEDGDQHTGFWWLLKARLDHGISMPIDLTPQNRMVPRHDLAKLVDSLLLPDRRDKFGRTWLFWAAQFGDSQIVEYLLANKDVDPNRTDQTDRTFARTPMLWAVEKYHQNVVGLMAQKKIKDLSLNYLIRHSETYEKEYGLEKLLNTFRKLVLWGKEVDPWILDRCDYEGTRPLHLACFHQHERLVDILMEDKIEGPLLDCQDRTGRTPLQYALHQKNESIVRKLLSSMSTLEYMRSSDWLELGNEDTYWVQINQYIPDYHFDWQPILKPECDLLPREGRRTLY